LGCMAAKQKSMFQMYNLEQMIVSPTNA
jgi:hypothetical protein